jgi:hypothetical protein
MQHLSHEVCGASLGWAGEDTYPYASYHATRRPGRSRPDGHSRLLLDIPVGNLAGLSFHRHTLFTYHRTWETGLGMEI